MSRLGSFTLMLLVHPSVPAKSVKELIAHARPIRASCRSPAATPRAWSPARRSKHWGKLDMLHVPYKSAPQALTDLLAGRVSMMFIDFTTGIPHVQVEGAPRAGGDAHPAQLAACPNCRPWTRRA